MDVLKAKLYSPKAYVTEFVLMCCKAFDSGGKLEYTEIITEYRGVYACTLRGSEMQLRPLEPDLDNANVGILHQKQGDVPHWYIPYICAKE